MLARTLDWEYGLHWDESSRNLEEVVVGLADFLRDENLWDPTDDDIEILGAIAPDSHSGIYHLEDDIDREMLHDLYDELVELVNDLLPDDRWFGYLNEGGGWGVWDFDFDGGF